MRLEKGPELAHLPVVEFGSKDADVWQSRLAQQQPVPAHQVLRTPTGEELIVLTREAFDDLIDIRDHARAMADLRAGRIETLTADEVDEALTAPSPLSFWRKKRGLTQKGLAEKVGISQAYLAQIETGKRGGNIVLYGKLARALTVRIEDLLDEGRP